MYVNKSMTFSTPHIGHSRHSVFFTRWVVNPMLNLLKRTMAYPGFEPRTFGLAVSIANHWLIFEGLATKVNLNKIQKDFGMG
jgi:hypothetical protein